MLHGCCIDPGELSEDLGSWSRYHRRRPLPPPGARAAGGTYRGYMDGQLRGSPVMFMKSDRDSSMMRASCVQRCRTNSGNEDGMRRVLTCQRRARRRDRYLVNGMLGDHY